MSLHMSRSPPTSTYSARGFSEGRSPPAVGLAVAGVGAPPGSMAEGTGPEMGLGDHAPPNGALLGPQSHQAPSGSSKGSWSGSESGAAACCRMLRHCCGRGCLVRKEVGKPEPTHRRISGWVRQKMRRRLSMPLSLPQTGSWSVGQGQELGCFKKRVRMFQSQFLLFFPPLASLIPHVEVL